jgi:hypothetical protein
MTWTEDFRTGIVGDGAGLGNSRFLTSFGMTKVKNGRNDDKNKKGLMGKKAVWLRGCKERGEWAELCFMALVAGMGMGVLRPFGDSRRYDVCVEAGGRIWRVQVKSTIYCRRGGEYSLNMMGPGRKRYEPGSVDFFAVFLIPVNQWYIIPYAALGNKLTVHFTPGGKRQKYAQYLEGWELLRGAAVNRSGGGERSGGASLLEP